MVVLVVVRLTPLSVIALKDAMDVDLVINFEPVPVGG